MTNKALLNLLSDLSQAKTPQDKDSLLDFDLSTQRCQTAEHNSSANITFKDFIPIIDRNEVPCKSSSEALNCDSLPGAGGEGGGEGCDEAWQETEGVLASQTKVDEGQDDASVDNVAQNRSKDVFSQAGDQKNHVFHLHNFTAH